MWSSIWGIHFTENLGHPFGQEPACKSYHVLTSCNSTRGIHLVGTRLQGLLCFYVMQGHLYWYFRKSLRHSILDKHLWHPFHWEFGAFIWSGGIHLAWNQIVRVAMFLHHAIPQGGIHLARSQIVRVAMFLCHTQSPLPVVHEKPLLVLQEKPLLVLQEKLMTFNVGQAFGASITPGIWAVHLARNQIARVAMFPCHTILQGDIPFGWKADCESCHVSTLCKVTSIGSSEKA